MKRALVTGITGQDGFYLTTLLLDRGYEVHGLVRDASRAADSEVARLPGRQPGRRPLRFHVADFGDARSLADLLQESEPDEIYHLAGQTQVASSFEDPEYTTEVGALGTLRLLDAARRAGAGARFFHAASSEMFGDADRSPQDEDTPFRPENPYAAVKLYAFTMVRIYRRAHGLFACNGILYNHESPHRAEGFVTRKVARAAAAIAAGRERTLTLGNLEARRDWGYAGDFVEGFWTMLQAAEPDDYVLATGQTHSVRELCDLAFRRVGLDYRDHVRSDPRHERPFDRHAPCGNAARAREKLGWRPRVGFPELVSMMVDAERTRLEPGP